MVLTVIFGQLLLDLNLPSLIQILHDGNDTHKQGGMIFSNSYAMPYAVFTMVTFSLLFFAYCILLTDY